MPSAVDLLMSMFGTNFTRNSKFHIRMTTLCQLRDSVTPALSANTGFKSLAFILFVILHLQNCDVKFQNFQRAITQKKSYEFFF